MHFRRNWPAVGWLVLTACRGDGPLTLPSTELHVQDEFPDFADWGPIRDAELVDSAVVYLSASPPYVHVLRDHSEQAWRGTDDGQGALLSPEAILGAGNDVIIWDVGSGRLQRRDLDGSVVYDVRLRPPLSGGVAADITRATYGDPFRMRSLGKRLIRGSYRYGLTGQQDYRQGELIAFEPSSGETTTLLDFQRDLEIAVTAAPIFSAIPLWDVCGDELRVLDPESGLLLALSEVGVRTPVAQVPTALLERPVRDEMLAAFLRHMASVEGATQHMSEREIEEFIAARLPEMRHQAAEYVPVAVDLRCGSDNTTWLREFDASTDGLGRGTRWLRYRQGVWDRIVLPSHFEPLRFASSEVWGVITAESGLHWPAVVDLTSTQSP